MRQTSFMAASVAVLSLLTPVQAQNAAGTTKSAGDETVVVTGTRRAVAYQDTDVSVTVIDRAMLNDARIYDVSALDTAVPNVQFNELGQLSSTYITIRGIESNSFIVNRAAVYIDGTPFRELSNAVLNQVESIEVLRGPQATLYGANSESGLIVINTRAPSDTTTGDIRGTGTLHSNGGSGEADGFIAGPLDGQTLTGSLAFQYSDGDSFLRNIHEGAPAGSVREMFVQGRLRWQPVGALTVNATAYILDTHAPGIFDQDYLPLDLDLYNRLYANTFNGGKMVGKFTYNNDAPKSTEEREVVAGASANYALGFGSLDAALSYRRFKVDSRGLDFDFSGLTTTAGQEVSAKNFWNGELRFSSPADDPFNYIVGVSHYREDISGFKATFVGAGTIDSYVAAPNQYSDARDWGFFASANWSPEAMPKLTLSAGLRYDLAHRESSQKAGILDLGGYVLAYTDASLSGDFTALIPRFSIRYEPSSQLTFYANAASGYIPGGFNLSAAQDATLGSAILRYESEKAWSYEAGFKWHSQDGRFHLAGSGYYLRVNHWQELQVATDEQGRLLSSDYIGSDASIDSKGFELEAVAIVLSGLTLTGNLGYTDARYLNLQTDLTTNLRGRRVKLVPLYDGALTAKYQLPSGWFARAELSVTGDETLENTGSAVQPDTQTIGLQVGYDATHWSARLFVENLTNVRRATGMAFRNFALGNDGIWYAPIERSRQFGIEVSASL